MGSASSGRRGWHVPGDQDVCPGCGVMAYPGEMFCVSCGAYMGWDTTGSGPVVRPEPARPVPVDPEPPPPPATDPGAGRGDSGEDLSRPSSVTPGADRPMTTWPDPVWPDPPAAQPSTAPARPEPAHRRPEVSFPAETGPLGTPPAVVSPSGHPGYPGAATVAPESAAEQTQVITGEVVLWTTLPEGDRSAPDTPTPTDGVPHLLPCPECRESNAESRTYCHPCGALLRPEPEREPPVLTRWQRLRKEYTERPDVWHWDRRWGVVLAALPVCVVAGVSLGGAAAAAQGAVPLVKDRFLAQYAVAPDTVSASSSAKGFDANLASDGIDNKAWAPKGTGDDAVGQHWTATFQSPFRLTSLVIVNGASKAPGQFFETGRPTKIKVTATTVGKGTVEKEIELGGRPGPQRFDLGIDDVTSVQVLIEAVHPGLKPDMPVALAEIQFFTRQES